MTYDNISLYICQRMLSSYSGNSDLKEHTLQDFLLKDVQMKTHIALEKTNMDFLCRDLSSNRLAAIPQNLFLLLEDLLQL